MSLTIVIVSNGAICSYVQLMLTGMMMMEGKQRTNAVQPTSQADGAWKRAEIFLAPLHTTPALRLGICVT